MVAKCKTLTEMRNSLEAVTFGMMQIEDRLLDLEMDHGCDMSPVAAAHHQLILTIAQEFAKIDPDFEDAVFMSYGGVSADEWRKLGRGRSE